METGECEVCGRRTGLLRARIECVTLNVCGPCSRLGQVLAEPKKHVMKKPPKPLEIASVDPNFAQIIKKAREAACMNREELANKINEKVSVVERVEHGMQPSGKLAGKLEKALKIELLGYKESDVKIKPAAGPEITIGDVVKIKVKKK